MQRRAFTLFAGATLALGTAAMFTPVEWRLPGPAAPVATSTTTASPRPSAFAFAVDEFLSRWNHLSVDVPDLGIQGTTPLSATLHHTALVGAEALSVGDASIDLFLFTDEAGDVAQLLIQFQGSDPDVQMFDFLGIYAAAAVLGLDTVGEAARFAVPIMGIELFPIIDYHSIDEESLITMRIGSVSLIREASPGLLAYRVVP